MVELLASPAGVGGDEGSSPHPPRQSEIMARRKAREVFIVNVVDR